jgi:hypothetical protein
MVIKGELLVVHYREEIWKALSDVTWCIYLNIYLNKRGDLTWLT